MSDNRRLAIHLNLDFLAKSVAQHVADIKQVAKSKGVSHKEALKEWRRVAKVANLSKDRVKAVERHF